VGYCGVTSVRDNDCSAGDRGFFELETMNSTDAQRKCLRLCRGCARCHAVSFSLKHHDCSWFATCDMSRLCNDIKGFWTVAKLHGGPKPVSTPNKCATGRPKAPLGRPTDWERCPGARAPLRCLSSEPLLPLDRAVHVLLGVFSHATSKGSKLRRDFMRATRVHHLAIEQRFVMSADEEPNISAAERRDISFLRIGGSRYLSLIGKFLLQNAYFRWAMCHRQLRLIGRLDDDVFFNSSEMVGRLLGADLGCPIIFGAFPSWYGWNNRSFAGVCFDYTPWRMLNAQTTMPPGSDQCNDPGTEGPFLFATGPFVLYSLSAAVGVFGGPQPLQDESTVMEMPTSGERFLHPQERRLVLPYEQWRPYWLWEDIYAGALAYRAFGAQPLTLLSVPLHQWNTIENERPRQSAILHGIKSEKQRELVRSLFPLTPRPPLESPPLLCNRIEAIHCCHVWRMCHANDYSWESPAAKLDWAG